MSLIGIINKCLDNFAERLNETALMTARKNYESDCFRCSNYIFKEEVCKLGTELEEECLFNKFKHRKED